MRVLYMLCAAIIAVIGSIAVATDGVAGVPEESAVLKDIDSVRACGPIACYVALKRIGIDVSLKEMIDKCAWQKGQRTAVLDMYRVLCGYADVEAVRMPPARLHSYISSRSAVAAVLLVRKWEEDVDHVCVAVDTEGDKIMIIDYPELQVRLSQEELAKIWDGEALVVCRRGTMVADGWPLWLTMTCFGTGLLIVGAGAIATRRRVRGAERLRKQA